VRILASEGAPREDPVGTAADSLRLEPLCAASSRTGNGELKLLVDMLAGIKKKPKIRSADK